MTAIFKMATKIKFAYVAKKTLVRLRTFSQFNYAIEKNKKKYLKAPKSKMAAQFNMAAKI
jgi:hypothetical protein